MPSISSPILTSLVVVFCLVGCAFETDEDQLKITGTAPEAGENWPADQPVRIFFDRYLNAQSLDRSKFALSSGEANASIGLGYDPVGPSVVIQPRLVMRVGLGYSLRVEKGAIRGFDGTALSDELTINFTTTPPAHVRPDSEPVDFETDLKPIIEARCGCHGPEPAAFPELSPDALIDQAAQRQENRVLVRPGEPLRSYLVQRILEGYPGVRGMEKELSDDERRLFIRWVTELSGTGM